MPSHPLTNFEIQNYYQNQPKFNDAYSRINLSKIKDKAYIINPYEYESIATHQIALYVIAKRVTNFNWFGVEHIPKQIIKFIKNKNIIINI